MATYQTEHGPERRVELAHLGALAALRERLQTAQERAATAADAMLCFHLASTCDRLWLAATSALAAHPDRCEEFDRALRDVTRELERLALVALREGT